MCMHTTSSLPIQLLMNIYIVSISWVLWPMLQWMLEYNISLWDFIFISFRYIHPDVRMDLKVMLFLIFWETSKLFSTVAVQVYIPNNTHSLFSTFSPIFSHYFLSFVMVTILIAMRWHLIVVLINISLMINAVEHLFMHLLAICISSLERYLFSSPAHSFIRLFFCYWFLWVLYIPCICYAMLCYA